MVAGQVHLGYLGTYHRGLLPWRCRGLFDCRREVLRSAHPLPLPVAPGVLEYPNQDSAHWSRLPVYLTKSWEGAVEHERLPRKRAFVVNRANSPHSCFTDRGHVARAMREQQENSCPATIVHRVFSGRPDGRDRTAIEAGDARSSGHRMTAPPSVRLNRGELRSRSILARFLAEIVDAYRGSPPGGNPLEP